MITQTELKSILDYDPDTGVFTARNNYKKWVRGKEVGTLNTCGYRQIGINGRLYLGHRLAWLYVYGVWPEAGIDHRNRIRDDNRICNLREATQADQRQNQSDVAGCYYSTQIKRWVAQIKINRKQRHIGCYSTKEEAHAAYLAAKKVTHIFNPSY